MLARITLTLGFTVVMLYVAAAQSTRPADASDAIAALVTELRAVRTELSEASQRSLRFQLLLARLQLQEQRIGHLDRQRAEVAKSLMDTQSMSTLFTGQYDQFVRGCAENASPEFRKECESQLETMKVTTNAHQAREQQLRVQEQELSQAIATEQNRWADFSARLDELERALARSR
jgi:hypothetical protein